MKPFRTAGRILCTFYYFTLRSTKGYHKPNSSLTAEQLSRVGQNLGSLQDKESFEAALRREFQNLGVEGYRKRLEIESRTDKGERIWLSHYIHNGIFQHWIIITHGFKYELRRSNNEGVSKTKKFLIKSGFGGEYHFNIQPATVLEERRQMAVTDHQKPIVGQHFLSMIGWTLKSRQEADAAGQAVMDNFGTYTYLYNNCQDFLRRFAKKIITHKADDWKWFFEGALSRYQYVPVTTPVELAILAKVTLESMKSLRGTVTGQDAVILELNISRNETYINEQENSYVDERSGPDGTDGGPDGGGHDGGNDGGA